MSLYKQWNTSLENIKTQAAYKEFWNDYMVKETEAYKKILASKNPVLEGKIKELAPQFNMTPEYFVGYLDGANTSFTEELKLEDLTEDSNIRVEFDWEKLLWNMHDAKAEWLYKLKEWEGIFDEEKRTEIRKEYNRSKQAVREVKVGRNDPCPCGSGKKYKKCCGKNA